MNLITGGFQSAPDIRNWIRGCPGSTLTSGFSSPEITEGNLPTIPEGAHASGLWAGADLVLILASTSCNWGDPTSLRFRSLLCTMGTIYSTKQHCGERLTQRSFAFCHWYILFSPKPHHLPLSRLTHFPGPSWKW